MSRRIAFLASMLVLSLAACSPGPATSPAVSSSSAASSARPTPTPGPTPTPQVAEACASKKIPFDAENIELSGPWRGNDGGIYYLRQRDNVVWWNGMSGSNGQPSEFGREWNNVGRGEIRDLIIFVEWADVPRGRILDGGTLEVTIGPDASGNLQLTKTRELEGDFGNGGWTPCTVG